MSGKSLVFLGLVAACGYALTRTVPPVAPGASAADSAAVAHAGVGARFEYGLGAVGSRIVGNSVRGAVDQTQQSLADMRAAIKATKGSDGVRAQKYAQEVVQMDSMALVSLELGQPLKAMKASMEAKSLLNSVRAQIQK